MPLTIIADADIKVQSISWSSEYGLGLNTDKPSNTNGEKVHVIFWTEEEVLKDEQGYYIDAEDAMNGLLNVRCPEIIITHDDVEKMLSY